MLAGCTYTKLLFSHVPVEKGGTPSNGWQVLCDDAGIWLQAAQADVFEEEHQDEDEEGLCTVCWEQGREVIFFDCMHMVCAPLAI